MQQQQQLTLLDLQQATTAATACWYSNPRRYSALDSCRSNDQRVWHSIRSGTCTSRREPLAVCWYSTRNVAWLPRCRSSSAVRRSAWRRTSRPSMARGSLSYTAANRLCPYSLESGPRSGSRTITCTINLPSASASVPCCCVGCSTRHCCRCRLNCCSSSSRWCLMRRRTRSRRRFDSCVWSIEYNAPRTVMSLARVMH